tara:strand:- start:274 stop:627 length:354 start_codon:yes stop_codon:yes gene_type:complete
MTKYCQNRLCHYNNTQDRLRAKKSAEPYYVNKKAGGYMDMFCSQGCMHKYFDMYKDLIHRTIGEQGQMTRKATDLGPWAEWQQHPNYNSDSGPNGSYELYNENKARFDKQWLTDHNL